MEQLLYRTIRVVSFIGLAALATLLTMFFGTSRSQSNLSSEEGFTGFGIQCANADAPVVVDPAACTDGGCGGCAGSDSGCSGGCDSGGGGGSSDAG